MRIGDYELLLERGLVKKKRILAVSAPGVGKSFTVRHVCRKLGLELITLSVPLQSPVKVGGYPRPPVEPDGDATHALFDGVARAMRATKPTCLFWDDLGMGGGETLKSVLDTVQFGRIDGRTLPDCVIQTAATNGVGHGADVQGLIEPLKTRWHTIVNIESHVDDVVQYGLSRNWPTDLLAYLRNAPDALHDWKPSKGMSIDGATPRGWEYVAEWVNDGICDAEVLAGCVGKGRAAQYLSFRELMNELPDIDQVLLNPDSAPVPENPSARYLVAMALAGRLSANNFGRATTYLHRLPGMFEAFAITDAVAAESRLRSTGDLPKNHQPLHMSRDFIAWSTTPIAKAIQAA